MSAKEIYETLKPSLPWLMSVKACSETNRIYLYSANLPTTKLSFAKVGYPGSEYPGKWVPMTTSHISRALGGELLVAGILHQGRVARPNPLRGFCHSRGELLAIVGDDYGPAEQCCVIEGVDVAWSDIEKYQRSETTSEGRLLVARHALIEPTKFTFSDDNGENPVSLVIAGAKASPRSKGGIALLEAIGFGVSAAIRDIDANECWNS